MSRTIHQATSTVVAKINNIEVIVIQDDDEMVPVTPICDLLGIASNAQIERVKRDGILSSVHRIIRSTGSDKKQYEMFSIPLKFTFGWLFTIEHERVKPEAREAVIEYKLECYNALYNHFTGARKFLELKEKATEKLVMRQKFDRSNFRDAEKKLRKTTKQLEELASMTYQEYLENNRQLTIAWPEDTATEINQ